MTELDPALEVVRMFDGVAAQDFDAIGDLLTDDVSMHLPFQVPGLASQAHGRAAVLGFLRTSQAFDSFTLTITGCRRIAGSDEILVNYEGDSTVRSSGRPYRNTYVAVFGFRDGALASWIEYYDPIVLCDALDLDPRSGRAATT